ncbi:MAG: hypothetical protein V4773_13435 [Verrucomicrobiota bacterium]
MDSSIASAPAASAATVAPSSEITADHTVAFSVNIVLDPAVMRGPRTFFLEMLLGSGGRLNASAQFTRLEVTGGGIEADGMSPGVMGDFASGFLMTSQPGRQAPQVVGQLTKTATQVSFQVELTTNCARADSLTFWLSDDCGYYLPTTAPGQPGLIARVAWGTDATFFADGFQGNGWLGESSLYAFRGAVMDL